MLLWDIIRDWFVLNIWGGTTSNMEVTGGFLGQTIDSTGGSIDNSWTHYFYIPIKAFVDNEFTGEVSYITLSDWLSTTSTIIVLVILCIIFGLMVRWLFRLTSGLLQGR